MGLKSFSNAELTEVMSGIYFLDSFVLGRALLILICIRGFKYLIALPCVPEGMTLIRVVSDRSVWEEIAVCRV